MYFLTEEEKRLLLRGLLPKARKMEITPELRGWNWHEAPLAPIYEIPLAIYETSNEYCSTNRDLYLRRVLKEKNKANLAMVEGKIFHHILAEILVKAKELIYSYGPERAELVVSKLLKFVPMDKVEANEIVKQNGLIICDLKALERKVRIITDFEINRIISRLLEVLTKQPHIGKDSLAALTVPVVVEQKLDGRFLGLSPNLSSDAFTYNEPMVLDLKFGEPRDFHKLSVTGYALVMEAIHEYPVNTGCIVYAKFAKDRLLIKREMFIIDEELRQWFLESRDQKARMIYEEIDPGISDTCYKDCPYLDTCQPGA
ncbi:MAG: type I-A CRISPR-associated protein Cas4/Csa1 [Desulfitobacterium hafniense]|nr:type I-A CRISPR-associated protein Cas4/Csa1 [Desulfitobacterium hafniense]